MKLVNRDRRAQRVPLAAPRQPRLVAPLKTAQVCDDGSVVRPQLHLKAVRISLHQHLTLRADQLELVQRARTHARYKRLPYARNAARLHRMALAVPGIEVTDYADAPRVRRPHGEAHAVRAIALDRVSAELLVDVVVSAFAEEMQVEIGEGGHEKALGDWRLVEASFHANRWRTQVEGTPIMQELRVHRYHGSRADQRLPKSPV